MDLYPNNTPPKNSFLKTPYLHFALTLEFSSCILLVIIFLRFRIDPGGIGGFFVVVSLLQALFMVAVAPIMAFAGLRKLRNRYFIGVEMVLLVVYSLLLVINLPALVSMDLQLPWGLLVFWLIGVPALVVLFEFFVDALFVANKVWT